MAQDQIWASTLQKSNLFMKELAAELGFGLEDALLAFRTVMHALRDRLPAEAAAHLAAQFPLLLKGVYFDGWSPGRAPNKIKTKEEFFETVSPALLRGIRRFDVEQVTRTVLRVVATHLSDGEVEQIRRIIPEDLRELWPEGSTARL